MKWWSQVKPRWLRQEFWPTYLLYVPFFFQWCFFALRLRSALYFTAVNPGMKNGGLLLSPKEEAMDQLDSQYVPRTFTVETESTISDELKNDLVDVFPVVVKPTMGWRGYGIQFCENMEELQEVFPLTYEAHIQEYIDLPYEFGVFIYQDPTSLEFAVTGIVDKVFLSITGDGQHTFAELLEKEERSYGRLSDLKKRHEKEWDQVVPKGQDILVEPIGNHNRGTIFYDRTDLVNEKVVKVFSHLLDSMDEVYWGRFDLKASSYESLETGEGIKIIEFNGCMAEPVHMYDPDHSIIDTFRIHLQHSKLNFEVAKKNISKGHKPLTVMQFLREWRIHKRYKRSLLAVEDD